MRIVVIRAVLFITLMARLGGATYYVDYLGGEDANDGTGVATPWKHCPGDPAAAGNPAARPLSPGDTVVFKGGVTYVLSSGTGILLNWDGEPGGVITYDGNSDGRWGTGRAQFTDGHGDQSIAAFSAASPRQYLSFLHLDIGNIGGAASLPPDLGSPVTPRFGAGIAFYSGVTAVTIGDCVFHELGYWYSQRPMNAASIAGAGIWSSSCHGLTISRCDFSRVAIGCNLSEAAVLDRVEIANCTFHEGMVWPIALPGAAPAEAARAVSVHGCDESDHAEFQAGSWAGYGRSPRMDLARRSAGTPFTLRASAIASPPPSFQWQRNGIPIPGATTAALSLQAVTVTDSGVYTVIASNAGGSNASNSVVLVVTSDHSEPLPTVYPLAPPMITAQPVGQTATALASVTFAVSASGSPTSFQWLKNGIPLPSSTGTTLTLESLTTNDAAAYTVVVANSAGSVVSAPAILTVNNAPAVSIEPAQQTVAAYGTATFTAHVTGTPALNLQWRKNGVPLPSSTGTTLTLESVTSNDVAIYTVVATNSAGEAVSNDAALTVADAPSSGEPSLGYTALMDASGTSVMVVTGNPVTFDLVVSGATPLRILVRAIGPSLAAFGLSGVLADPELEIYSGSTLLAQNDNWGGDSIVRNAFSAVGAFPLDSASKDAVALVTLPPGVYTAVVSGVDGATGTVLIEYYGLP